MNKEECKKIRKVAKRVRKAFNKIAKSECYNKDLGGLCGRSAVQLFLELKREGINPQLAFNDQHGFCFYKGHTIDVTATQFGKFPEVLIKKFKRGQHYFYNYVLKRRSVKSLLKERRIFTYFGAAHCWERDREIVKEHR